MDLSNGETPDIVRLWILRTVLKLGAIRRLVDPDEIGAGDVFSALGISFPSGRFPATAKSLVPKLRSMLAAYPIDVEDVPIPPQLASNIIRIGELLGLTSVERRLLGLAVLARTERALTAAMEMLGYIPTARAYQAVAVLVDATEREVREALCPRGALCRTGLIAVDRDNTSYLQNKIDVLSDGFAERMTLLEADPAELLQDKVFPSRPPTLAWADFGHVQELAELTRAHLGQSVTNLRCGTNILVHGVPGVGKTELARTLAAELGLELFEISSEDEDGDPIDGDRRLRAFRAAQWFFSRRKLLFLFDEVDDVFSGDDGFFRTRSSAQRRKAWMNRTLETNPVPTIWITNYVHSLDPAFVRRFDIVFEMPNPPLAQRKKIIRSATGRMNIDETVVSRLASEATLTPAVVSRAAEVAGLTTEGGKSNGQAAAIVLLVDATLRAQGHAGISKAAPSVLPGIYNTKFINADTEISALSSSLKSGSSARILLHGPPGTGKTAFAQWLARELGVPLNVKRASDLLSMYVGQTEKLLAAAFSDATQDGAALLIDEVDSFLQDRRDTRASWEISLVNEMLTQMESFPGIMLASTNLLSSLDFASLRRFDLKVGLRHLRPEQSWELFMTICEALGVTDIEPQLEHRIRRIGALTPGDFAVVLRQAAFKPPADSMDVYRALVMECEIKEPKSHKIGFT